MCKIHKLFKRQCSYSYIYLGHIILNIYLNWNLSEEMCSALLLSYTHVMHYCNKIKFNRIQNITCILLKRINLYCRLIGCLWILTFCRGHLTSIIWISHPWCFSTTPLSFFCWTYQPIPKLGDNVWMWFKSSLQSGNQVAAIRHFKATRLSFTDKI